jgi:nitrate/nitrite transporter NarK
VSATVRATVGGCALGVAVAWPVTNIGAIADAVAVDYGVSLAVVGLFTTALFVTHTSLQIPAGKAVDALGARRVGLVALLVVAATSSLALVAPEPALVLVARTLTGIGTALGFVAGIDYVRAHGGSAFTQGLYGGLAMAGAGAALAIVPIAEDWLDWRAPFVTSLVVAAAAAVLLLLGPADSQRVLPELHASVQPGPGVLRDGRLYRLCFVYMASFGLSIVLGNWVVTLLTRAGGASEAAAGAVGSLILLGGVVSRPLGGTLARRYGDRMRLILGASFVASAVGAAILAIAGPLALSTFGALVLGLAAGIPFAACFAAATRTRADAPAAAAAMVNMSGNIVIVVCTPLLGLAFSLPGDGRIGFAAAAAIWLATLALLPLVRELDTAPRSEPATAR